MNGYAGNILRVNLTDRTTTTILTSDYEQWGGGHGIGSAIFFDLVKDKAINGFDPGNIITIMTSPLSGTIVPGASARTEVQAIGVQSYPVGWFTRSNFGGRFAAMLKYAQWDGIVIEGKANTPVWIDIRDRGVTIRDARGLWGLDTWKTQKKIWGIIAGKGKYDDWLKLDVNNNSVRTTQRPAVLTIGPAGECLSRLACLIHDAANASGQGGFGAVWGSKNLKAISVIGTGGITIYDPKALINARLSQMDNYGFDLDDLKTTCPSEFHGPPGQGVIWEMIPTKQSKGGKRPQACVGCHSGCRRRFESGLGNEASCSSTAFYMAAKTPEIQYKATDLLNKYGINALEAHYALEYILKLNKAGILGPGKEIDCPLRFDNYRSLEFVTQYLKMIAYRDDGLGNACKFGNDIAEGVVRAAQKWGRLEGDQGDLKTGELPFPYWGMPNHFDPRAELEWGYGSILGDRDINEHCINRLSSYASAKYGLSHQMPAEAVVKIATDKMVPYQGNRLMLDFSTENMYSEHIAKLVAWHRHYTRFWKQSALYCDWRWPDFINLYASENVGSTGEAEPAFYHAVTGKNFTFLDGIELGRKIWNIDHAIWTLQGRHRDMVHFADYIYNVPYGSKNKQLTGREKGKWTYINPVGRSVDRKKFEEFKTIFYELEGWNVTTGWPKRSSLESIGLGFVADELEKHAKLGSEQA